MALENALGEIPSGAQILEEKEITPKKVIKTTAFSFDEQSARSIAESEAKQRSANMITFQSIRLLKEGYKGFFGIGKTLNQYAIELVEHLPAVEVTV
ncbi:MAG: hypothetical protein ACRERV_01810 [Methylococcales bacterium]